MLKLGRRTVTLQPSNDEFDETTKAEQDARNKLEQDLRSTQKSAYAQGTLNNFLCYWRAFIRFSKKYKIYEWPVSVHTLCLFAQHLAYTFHSSKSVRNYLFGIRTLHILARMEPPNLKDIEVSLTLRGLAKKMKNTVRRAHPLTPSILLDILSLLNLNKKADLVFWATLVVGFFGMLRKSNLMPDAKNSFDPERQLSRGHVYFSEGIAVIKITWAKNIQFKQKVLEIPLFEILNSPLCPVTLLKVLLAEPGKDHYPLFGSGHKVLLTYNQFQNRLKSLLKRAGYREKSFSSHSMRRGV